MDHSSRTAGFSTASRSRPELAQGPRTCRPALTVIGHPDPERVGDRAWLGERDRGREAHLSRRRPSFEIPGSTGTGRALDDRWLSRQPVVLRPVELDGAPHIEISGEGTRTSLRFDGEPAGGAGVFPRQALVSGVVLTLARRIVLLLHEATPCAPGDLPAAHGLVGWSDAMIQVRQAIDRVAPLEMPVLIRGATGTGKELVASALHRASRRSAGPFVGVNLGALPPTLAAAELFGAVKGAFTGADHPRPGFFGQAEGGTLFLDEIGEAPPEIQVMLLRALETGEIYPVGSTRPRALDLRIVAATDSDLERRIEAGDFRAPLLHRLASYEIFLPRLAGRRDDLGRLLRSFLDLELEALGAPVLGIRGDGEPWIRAELLERLLAAPWPGNVRQLRNLARTLIVHRTEDGLFEGGSHLRLEGRGPERPSATESASPGSPCPPEAPSPSEKRRRKPREIDDEEIRRALRSRRWSVQGAAEELGIPRTSLASRLAGIAEIRTVADLDPEEIRKGFERSAGDLGAMVDELQVSEHGLRQRLRALGLAPKADTERGAG